MADQAIVERSCAKLTSAIADGSTNFTGDLQEMLKMLKEIQAAMPDTERLSDSTHKEWVKKASTAAYGVFELVDKFLLQSARIPAKEKILDVPQSKMPEKMKKMKETLKELAKESIGFDVKSHASNPTTVPTGAIVGRDEQREKIIAQLSEGCHSEEPIILLLAGEEGIGKTSVAEMVFNDTRFRCYYRVWVNNSMELHEIGKSIIFQLSGKEEMRHASEDDLDSIMDRLHELLNGIKVLVVLDDLFMAYSEWKPLKRMFTVRDKGSQVIVLATTAYPPRSYSVAHVHVHNLPPLTDDMCCAIIKHRSGRFGDRSTKKDLEQIAQELAKCCGGLPLAAQLFGGLLKFKRNEEWPTLLEQTPRPWPNPVDLSLKLSYESMSGPLKLCLEYCTISCLVAHRRLVKEDLIHQWIALGLIEPSDGTISAINLAEDHINRLLDMAFLQTANLPPPGGNDESGAILFNMHDRILQYGYTLIDDYWAIVDDPEDYNVTEHCRHVVLLGKAWPSKLMSPDRNIIISSIHCFHCKDMDLSEYSFSVPSCLRVLNLEKTAIQRLPILICRLEQLGYLNLSGCSGLVGLPEIFGELKRLIHINLSGCSGLIILPQSFGELKILRYINLSGCSGLVTLPESFWKLIDLVHLDLSGCCQLRNLQESFGKLASLMHLNLSGCSGLETLPQSFVKLIKLVHISLSNCSGLSKLPQSFGKLTSLEHINLSGCSRLVTLPRSFGDLRNVLHIDLSRCSGLSKLPGSFVKLQKLTHICLSGCSGLETLPESFGRLTNLLHIDLSRCCGLSKLPESFKNLRKLVYLDLSYWSCFQGIKIALGGLTSLQHLNLSNPCCYRADQSYLEELKEVFGNLSGLQYLNLSMLLNPLSYRRSKKEERENLEYIGCIRGMYRLEHLDLSHNIFLHDLPESLSGLCSLHTLDLSGCIRLKKLGSWMTNMHSLKSIILRDCEGLESYSFKVGVENNINNYVQLQEVTSETLEITCLENMKDLKQAERIKLDEKLKLQRLKLCWSGSLQENKSDRSAETGSLQENKLDKIEHGVSLERNKLDLPAVEIEHEVSVEENDPKVSLEKNSSVKEIEEDEVYVERNELDMSVEETGPKVSVEKNRRVHEIGEHEIYVERNEHDQGYVEKNKHARSAEEIEQAEVSGEKNKAERSRSVEEIELAEVSGERNKTDRSKSAEEIEPAEVSEERNKTHRSAEEIEQAEVSGEKNKSVRSKSAGEIEPAEVSGERNKTDRSKSAEEIEPAEVSGEKNKTHRSAEEMEQAEVSGEKNKSVRSKSAGEIEPTEVSGERNKTDRSKSAKEIEPAEVSGEKNKTHTSTQETEPAEVSGEKNKTHRSAEEMEQAEVSGEKNKSVRSKSAGEIEPAEVSGERNKTDRSKSAKEIEPAEVSGEKNKTHRSAEEIEQAEVSGEKNKSVRSKSAGEIEPSEVSGERNKTDRSKSAEEIEPAEVSGEKNKTITSTQEIDPTEVSGEKNKTHTSTQETEPAEVSGEKNKTHTSTQEIEPAEVSGEMNKTDSSAEKIESDASLEKNRLDDGSMEDNDLLGALRPPRNLKYLELHGYRGKICRPSWLFEEKNSADLLNLVEVTMQDFPSCQTLPPFGLLPKLQRLVVRRMANVRIIDAGDLIGSNRPEQAQCTIELDDMSVLQEFNTTHTSGAKHQLVLLVHKCPSLRFGTLPPRFRRLEISKCDQGMTSVGKRQQGYEKQDKNCSVPMYRWSLLDHSSARRSLSIQNCSLHELRGDNCISKQEYQGHFISVEELKIKSCQGLDNLLSWRVIPKPTSLKKLHLTDCKDIGELQKVFEDLANLEELWIERCPEIKDLEDSISKLKHLKYLYVIECPSLKRWCEKKDNKKLLGDRLRLKYELPKTDEQPKRS